MCGIVGIASRVASADVELLRGMRDTLSHRGPDDAGDWWSADGRVGLAHRRLSIIDLSEAGHQPMSAANGGVWIVFNGEIYNYADLRDELITRGHSFRSSSDTEVIIEAYRAWGLDCLSRLNGMFAFGIYDADRKRLFLARDRAGEKPLFCWQSSDRLVFASEMKAIMADPSFHRQIDIDALQCYFAYGYVPGRKCIFRDVTKLGAGEAMTYDLESGERRRWCYWRLPEPCPAPHESVEDLLAELERLLLDSVRRRLVADVPVGVLLSGGVDSSLVTALAARVSPVPVKTFTISFPSYGSYDEGPFARIVANHFGTEHTELVAEPASVDLLGKLARQYDEPMADSSMLPTYLVSRLIRPHATVALGGDGGDELFGGYQHYSWIQCQERIRAFVPGFLRKTIGDAVAAHLPPGVRGRNYLIGFTADLAKSIAHVNMYFDAITRRRLLAPIISEHGDVGASPEQFKVGLCDCSLSPLQQACRVDFLTTMVDAYLVKIDRASMLASLEIRAPMLDHRLVEFAFGRLPDAQCATENQRKVLLRRLAEKMLPGDLDLRRKQGFSIPLDAWFSQDWGGFIQDVLSGVDKAFFDKGVVSDLISGQRRGRANTNRLFALTIFELWRREYGATL